MPRGDRTGPSGYGPMTGRGAGFCAGYGAPGFMNPAFGRGFRGGGRGFYGGGGGRGWRNRFQAAGAPGYGWNMPPYPGRVVEPYYGSYGAPEITAEQEIAMLRNQSEYMQKELSSITDRIKELEDIAAGERRTT